MKNTYFKLNKDHTTEAIFFDEYHEYSKKNITMKVVGKQKIGEDIEVSTVFLGINHAYNDNIEPILFETMVFGGKHDEFMMRYKTWDEAIDGHKRTVEMCGGEVKNMVECEEDSIDSRFDILDL